MLYTLTMLVCLSSAPEACEVREEIVWDLAANPGVAFMQAQAFVAHWIEEHPGRFVQRWRLLPDLKV
ncbi:hypothetical protein [Sinorhizobium terangae]|uniref:Uncharacterized protein n=1 Tax=Sinorhizobium terangae TaxID=110322 RepID=A0A6N7L9U1_SINTE|nr:hypothetical protein [Sinorhizobium terangae]MBB4187002.1 hypothetical protein [Sinorhizobium terangae]MQX14366.1 hypothetical protein [Sinorhizobium terangae]WFU49922.1 hypothetical protein QA637_24225 [Sinorhizobium terangae]